MTSVFQTLVMSPLASIRVEIFLAGVNGARVHGATYNGDAIDTTIFTRVAGNNPTWTANLLDNAGIVPNGTVWARKLSGPTVPAGQPPVFFTVPSTGGPWDVADLVTETPGSLSSPALGAHESKLLTRQVHGQVVHLWERDGWAPFRQQTVSTDGTHGPAVLSVVGQRGRGTNAEPEGNFREFLYHSALRFTDMEVKVFLHGSDIFTAQGVNPCRAQPGLALRLRQEGSFWRAFVASINIFSGSEIFPDVVNQNVWQTTGSVLTLGSNGNSNGIGAWTNKSLRVVAARRFQFGIWLDEYMVLPSHCYDLVAGDTLAISGVPSIGGFSNWNGTAVVLNGNPGRSSDYATLQCVSPDQATNTTVASFTTAPHMGGTILPAATHRRNYGFWIGALLQGNLFRTMAWRAHERQPDWHDTRRVGVFDAAGAQNPNPNTPAPNGDGFPALLFAHNRNGHFIEYEKFIVNSVN